MDEVEFRKIVREINWSETDYDEAMYWFMQHYSVQEADVPPRLYRQYPKIIETARLIIEKKWQKATDTYHLFFGAGYADNWPVNGYLIPNFIRDLEKYRLRKDPIHK